MTELLILTIALHFGADLERAAAIAERLAPELLTLGPDGEGITSKDPIGKPTRVVLRIREMVQEYA